MGRWLEATQAYDLKIGYVPGKANKVADALSRVHVTAILAVTTIFEEDAEGKLKPLRQTNYVPAHAELGWYDIEKLVDTRKIRNVLYYRVRWKGYAPSEDTWEKASKLKSDLGRDVFRTMEQRFLDSPRESLEPIP